MIALEETETEVGSCSARKTDRVPGKSRGAVRAESTKMRRRNSKPLTSRKIAKGARCEKRTRACCVEDAFLWRCLPGDECEGLRGRVFGVSGAPRLPCNHGFRKCPTHQCRHRCPRRTEGNASPSSTHLRHNTARWTLVASHL